MLKTIKLNPNNSLSYNFDINFSMFAIYATYTGSESKTEPVFNPFNTYMTTNTSK